MATAISTRVIARSERPRRSGPRGCEKRAARKKKTRGTNPGFRTPGLEPRGFCFLVPVVIRLVRPLDRNADIRRLLLRELRELRAELPEVETRDFFVEVLRK